MRKSKAIDAVTPCVVLRDRRERDETAKWDFGKSAFCAGTEEVHMETGDYTLRGFESYFAVERKGSVKDFVQSMAKGRFKEELIRMANLPHGFVVLEFHMEDLRDWPRSSGSSYSVQRRLPLRHPGAALSTYLTLKLGFPEIDFIFAGTCGKLVAGSIFKRIIEAYAAKVAEK